VASTAASIAPVSDKASPSDRARRGKGLTEIIARALLMRLRTWSGDVLVLKPQLVDERTARRPIGSLPDGGAPRISQTR